MPAVGSFLVPQDVAAACGFQTGTLNQGGGAYVAQPLFRVPVWNPQAAATS